jgi:hypothetical protein
MGEKWIAINDIAFYDGFDDLYCKFKKGDIIDFVKSDDNITYCNYIKDSNNNGYSLSKSEMEHFMPLNAYIADLRQTRINEILND